VVIAGMGDTGVLVAIHLSRRFDVVGVATRPALVSGQELGNRLGAPDHWRRNFLVPFDRFRKLDRCRLLHGRITAVDLDLQHVVVDLADGGRKIVPYDVLVVATGVTNGFWRNDHVQDLAAVDESMRSVADQLEAARTIAIVGGGPTGVSAAVGLAHRSPSSEVHLFHGHELPLPGYHERVRRRIDRELRAAGVTVHPGHRAVVPEEFSGDRLTEAPVSWTTGQAPFEADAVLWATGKVRPHTDFLPASMTDESGFVPVDEHLQVPGVANVFAVGDVAASDPNRSSARNFGYLVAARNVAAVLSGRPQRMRSFRAPEHRWGSVLGVQDDGMLVFQPDGRSFRVPRWAVQPFLFDLWLRVILYRGLRSPRRA
jgi:NADH dehydrogenase FAD-containing subunit